MIRCTIELIPHGQEGEKMSIGIVEIANTGTGDLERGNYVVTLKKTAPWGGALKRVWQRGMLVDDAAEHVEFGFLDGFPRHDRGVYDLLYRALKAVVGERNPE